MRLLPNVPERFPFDPKRVRDLKQKPEKKYASGCCAALVLTAQEALCDDSPLRATWAQVPRAPDPKYDDICDSMWNAVAFWNKAHGSKKRARGK